MRTCTETNYWLQGNETLTVTTHLNKSGTVSLYASGYGRGMRGRGFCVTFTTAHLPAVTRLLEALEMLKDLEDQVAEETEETQETEET